MRGGSGVAGKGRVVGVPMFHSWSKCSLVPRSRPSFLLLACSMEKRGDPGIFSHVSMT